MIRARPIPQRHTASPSGAAIIALAWLASLAAPAAPATAATAASAAVSAPVATADAAAWPAAVTPPRFDLSVNNAPAAQVFMQLGAGTPYNMLVAPEVGGNITITLKDTTVLEAMESMRELFGYDYRVAGNRIFVQPNTVQTRLFKINYLPGRREGASELRVTSSSINQGSTVGGSGGVTSSGFNNNSTSGSGSGSGGNSGGNGGRGDDTAHVRTTSDADFWREVKASLVSLIGTADQRSVVLNPAAGVIVVRATPGELRHVEAYLKAMQLSIERQVMLEAKIVMVELSQGSQAGVNWGAFGKLGSGQVSVGAAAPGARLAPTGPITDGVNVITAGADLVANALGKGFYGLAFQASNFAAMLNFLESPGNVLVLSSPRIATLNNQKAVLKVGADELFVTGVSTTTTTNGLGAISSPTLTLQPFFSGVALDVTPQIDDVGNVMLHIHPTVSRVSAKETVIDLGTLGALRLPLALSKVSETDSIVRVHDGQIVAIGGLMTQESRDDRNGLPVLGDLPFVGAFFRTKTGATSKFELVIMIKPSVISEEGPWPATDSRMSAAKP